MVDNSPQYRMSIVDIRVPFWRLVAFFVKSALAMIPAMIILTLLFIAFGIALGLLAQFLGLNVDMFPHRFRI